MKIIAAVQTKTQTPPGDGPNKMLVHPKINAIYRHYRTGENYLVIALALHTDNEVPTVVYKGLYECAMNPSNVWCRRLDDWCKNVQDNVSGEMVPRFSLVKNSHEDGDAEEHF